MKKMVTMSDELVHRINMYKEYEEYSSAKASVADLFTWVVGARGLFPDSHNKDDDIWNLLVNRLADFSEILDLFHNEANRE